MNVYILKKHPVSWGRGVLENFQIVAASLNKKELDELCKQKNQRSEKYFYKVGCLKVKP